MYRKVLCIRDYYSYDKELYFKCGLYYDYIILINPYIHFQVNVPGKKILIFGWIELPLSESFTTSNRKNYFIFPYELQRNNLILNKKIKNIFK